MATVMTRNQKVIVGMAALGGLAGLGYLLLKPRKAKAASSKPSAPPPPPPPSEPAPSPGGGGGGGKQKLLSDTEYDQAYDFLESLGYNPTRRHYVKFDGEVKRFQQDYNKVQANLGYNDTILVDGILGPQTAGALDQAMAWAGSAPEGNTTAEKWQWFVSEAEGGMA